MKLRLAPDFTLPPEGVTEKLAEEMHAAGAQVVVINVRRRWLGEGYR
jgi:hypothetical protein